MKLLFVITFLTSLAAFGQSDFSFFHPGGSGGITSIGLGSNDQMVELDGRMIHANDALPEMCGVCNMGKMSGYIFTKSAASDQSNVYHKECQLTDERMAQIEREFIAKYGEEKYGEVMSKARCTLEARENNPDPHCSGNYYTKEGDEYRCKSNETVVLKDKGDGTFENCNYDGSEGTNKDETFGDAGNHDKEEGTEQTEGLDQNGQTAVGLTDDDASPQEQQEDIVESTDIAKTEDESTTITDPNDVEGSGKGTVYLKSKETAYSNLKVDNADMFGFCNQFWGEDASSSFLPKDSSELYKVPNNIGFLKAYIEKRAFGETLLTDCQGKNKAKCDVIPEKRSSILSELGVTELTQNRDYLTPTETPEINAAQVKKLATHEILGQIVTCMSLKAVYAFNKYEGQHDNESAQSIDGAYKCSVDGKMEMWFSADFRSCQKIVNVYNAAMVAEGAMQAGIQLTDASKQTKIMEGLQGSEDNLQVSALEGQADMMKKKANNEVAKEAFFATKGVTIGALVAAYVTPKNFPKRCKRRLGKKSGNGDLAYALCHHAVMFDSESTDSFMFGNFDTKGAFVMAAAQAGVQAVAADLSRRQYKKMEAQLRGAADQLDGKTYDDLGIVEGDVALVHQCQMDPNAPGCVDGGELTYHNAAGTGGLEFEGGDSNTFDINGGMDDSVPLANTYDAVTPGSVGELNPGIASGSKKSSKTGFAPSSAATVSRGGTNLGTPGSAGGGGGASASGLGRAPRKSAGPTGLSNTYSRVGYKKGKRSKYGKGFRGIAGSRGGKSKNPFDMLKKGKKGGVKVNRNLAAHDIVSAKAGSIFERISNRYAKVQSQKRVATGTRMLPKIKK